MQKELEDRIDSSEQALKKAEFLELKNQSLESKMKKFEFLVRERDSYLAMYKNSQRKVNDLEGQNGVLEEDLGRIKMRMTHILNSIYETNDQGLINQIDRISSPY